MSRAVVVERGHTPGKLGDAEEIVAPMTAQGWTPLFTPAGSCLVEVIREFYFHLDTSQDCQITSPPNIIATILGYHGLALLLITKMLDG